MNVWIPEVFKICPENHSFIPPCYIQVMLEAEFSIYTDIKQTWDIPVVSPRMNPVSTEWLLQRCYLHVKAAFSRLDHSDSHNLQCIQLVHGEECDSGLMFHTVSQGVVLSSVMVEMSPGIFISIFISLLTWTLSQYVYTEWHLFASLSHCAPSTDQNHILCWLHQPLTQDKPVK